MDWVKILLELSKSYPVISTLLMGLAFGIAMFMLLLFVLNQMDKKFLEFKKSMSDDFDRRYGYIEKDIKETQELGRLFRERKDGCDAVQAAAPIIKDLTKTVESQGLFLLEKLQNDLEKMFLEFIKKFERSDRTEQQLNDIKKILAGHND
jgi:hypothetical protein